jgi:hypothetical protein
MFYGKNSRHRSYNFNCNHRMRSTCKCFLFASVAASTTDPNSETSDEGGINRPKLESQSNSELHVSGFKEKSSTSCYCN